MQTKRKIFFRLLFVSALLIVGVNNFNRYVEVPTVKGAKTEIKKYKALQTPNDNFFNDEWGITRTQTQLGWDITTGDQNLVIAVLDTGVLSNHQDLAGKLVTGYDFVGKCPNGYDYQPDNSQCLENQVIESTDSNPAFGGGNAVYHGTMVSGIVAAATNNSVGIAGTCWNCKIMPVRVLNNDGEGTSDVIAEAIRFATDNGAKVINMSFGYSHSLGPDSYLTDAINYANNHDVVLVAAAGNDGQGVNYPAAYENVIAVGAIDESDTRTSWSSYGSELDVVAPGVNILSPYIYWDNSHYVVNAYANASGTSMAAPFVSGLAGLISSNQSSLNNNQIIQKIKSNTENIGGQSGFSDYYGNGLINSYDSLSSNVLLSVTSGLSFSNSSPAVGEKLDGSFTIRNLNSSPITLDYLGVAARSGNKNVDLGWSTSVTLAAYGDPGGLDSRTVEVGRVQTEIGDIHAWISYCYQGSFYEAVPSSGQTTFINFTNRIPNIKAITIITNNPGNPKNNQVTGFSTTVKNNESKRIYYNHFGIASRKILDNSNSDIGWETGGYLEPGATKVLNFNRRLPLGEYYAWTSMHLGSDFYEVWDGLHVNHIYFPVVNPNVRATTLITAEPSIPQANVTANFSTTIYNDSNETYYFDHIGIANRNLATWENNDIGWYNGLNAVIGPHSSKTLNFTRTLAAGSYHAWTSMNLGNDFYEIWDDLNPNQLYFYVQ